jgi:hypothetical protein
MRRSTRSWIWWITAPSDNEAERSIEEELFDVAQYPGRKAFFNLK